MRVCSIEGCGGKHRAKGYCPRHYAIANRAGTLDLLIPGIDYVAPKNNDDFWEFVKKELNINA